MRSFEYETDDGTVVELVRTKHPKIGEYCRFRGQRMRRLPPRMGQPNIPILEHVAHSLPRCQGATPEARETERIQRGYPRINDKGQPVFLNRREINEYSSRSHGSHTYDRNPR
jgi:hypothetical protein